MWDSYNLNLLNNLSSHLSAVSSVKYGLNRLYSSGHDGKIYYYNSNISGTQNGIKTKSYSMNSLAISTKLQLIAFGCNTLNFYCLKNEIETGSVYLKEFITCLDFVKVMVVCGTNNGEIYLVDSRSLNIKK